MKICWNLFAPSILAASYKLISTCVNAAKKDNGTPSGLFQISDRITTQKIVFFFAMMLTGSIPRSEEELSRQSRKPARTDSA